MTPRVPGPCRVAGGKVRKRVGGVKPPDATSGRRRPACPLRSPRRSQPSRRIGGHHQRLAIQRSLTREERDSYAVAWFYTYMCASATFRGSGIQLGGRWILRLKHTGLSIYCSLFRIFRTDFISSTHACVQGSSLFYVETVIKVYCICVGW